MKITVTSFCLCLTVVSLLAQQHPKKIFSEDDLIDTYLKKGAHRYGIFAPEWGLYIDSALALNPSVAYLYQQRAMPLFKQKKYETGMKFLDKAVELDPHRYLDYRAFIKCIFSKRYNEAIADFEQAQKINGEHSFVMDHSYNFYIGLSYLQLNNFNKAKEYIARSLDYTKKIHGADWQHHLEHFYLGIAYQELQLYEEAIECFNHALSRYDNFSDAEYYKAHCLLRLGRRPIALPLIDKAEIDFKKGFTINEDNVIYERYPYQLEAWHFNRGN